VVKYQLSTGKTVLLTMEQYLELTDEKEQELIAADSGVEINDPFNDFSPIEPKEENIELEIEEIPLEEIKKIKKEFDDT